MTKIKIILAIIALATLACAQPQIASYQNLTVTEDGWIHLSVTMQYTTGSNCAGCATSYHTYSATAKIDGPNGPLTCSFYDGQPAYNEETYGCDVFSDYVGDASYTSTENEDVECSQMGAFYSLAIELPKITTSYSAYNVHDCLNTGFLPMTPCTFTPEGEGCPGKCSREMTKLVIGGTYGSHAPFSQCTDTIVNGMCATQWCFSTTKPGFCTSGVN